MLRGIGRRWTLKTVLILSLIVTTIFALGVPVGIQTTTAQGPQPTPSSDINPDSVQQSQTQTVGNDEVLMVYFQSGTTGVQTKKSYSGDVTITVSGVGQASGTQYSDAFYIYTDSNGNPVTPWHPTEFYNWTLWINDGPADSLVQSIPSYRDDHIYTFNIIAPGGLLTFAVGDTLTADNTGAYEIVITEGKNKGNSQASTLKVLNSLRPYAERLGVAVLDLIATLKGLGPYVSDLVDIWSIYKAVHLAEQFEQDEFRVGIIDEAYNCPKNDKLRESVDSHVEDFYGDGVTWSDLSFEQKVEEIPDLGLKFYEYIEWNFGGGGPSGYILPRFMNRWLGFGECLY